MNKKKIEAKARSASMNKWIRVFEEEFDLETKEDTPTKRMQEIIIQLHSLLPDDSDLIEEIENHIKKSVVSWYRIGARRGIAEFINALDEDLFGVLPDKITWKKSLKYHSFSKGKQQISSRHYTVEI